MCRDYFIVPFFLRYCYVYFQNKSYLGRGVIYCVDRLIVCREKVLSLHH